ncbi:MAG: hypothetical protein DWC06_06165 [Candidatus Poseidoniales archaeon]|nr:hypothetical protein [Candidatus Poseidoniales archaeon]RJV00643.1 MAG: hypothetical protein DWC06_06165 [Candidatus Poseidoniales archaeon]
MAELKETLDEKRKLVDQKATQYRTTRDDWNARTKEHTTIRNELNAEVRELIQNVRQQREIREQMNELVREKKSIRSEANKKVKQAKAMLDSERSDKNEAPAAGHRGGRRERKVTIHSLRRDLQKLEREFERGAHTGNNEKKVMKRMKEISSQIREMKASEDSNGELKEARGMLREAMIAQEEAHVEVQKAAQAAQEAHDLMLQWNKEVDRQREHAEEAHRELRKSKKEADKAHHFYIVSLRCLHSIQDMLRAMRGATTGESQRGARVEVQDLMSKLMSGDTLSTEELMKLQSRD